MTPTIILSGPESAAIEAELAEAYAKANRDAIDNYRRYLYM